MRMLVTIAAVVASLTAAAPRAQAPASVDLAQLVMRASSWTARFDQSLSGLLFRERYLQRASTSNVSAQVPLTMEASPTGSSRVVVPGREVVLEANVFLLRAPSAREFVIYRDVYRVGSRNVTDHTARLQELLTEGTASAIQQARALTDASARHNIGGISRNVNIPTMAFDYLTPAYVGGLRVRQAGADTIDGLPVLIVEFEEIARPTLVRGERDADVPASGRYWIHPGSGAVPRAVAEFTTGRTRGRMEVRLALHDLLKVWVPKEMTEVWSGPGRHVSGLAHYDQFTRLNVTTAEIIK
ncbi:MAG TPA: hypothetical protein VFZ36_11035 [Vicinamibacterales bacterium]